jgi:hypothetical protein
LLTISPSTLMRTGATPESSEARGAATTFLPSDESRFMTAMERVWIRMKTAATSLGARKRLVGLAESRDTVLKLCRSEKASPPPGDALEYLAVEFVRLTSERQTP